VKEVAKLSLLSSACGVVSAVCSCLRGVCAAAERGVWSVTEPAQLKPRSDSLFVVFSSVAAASEYASKGWDKLGEKLPLLQKPVEQVI
ncbi:PLIN3 protein, partial [Notiomystis cincta]|nr:PLIN3 protein [Notiomystis cincta]